MDTFRRNPEKSANRSSSWSEWSWDAHGRGTRYRVNQRGKTVYQYKREEPTPRHDYQSSYDHEQPLSEIAPISQLFQDFDPYGKAYTTNGGGASDIPGDEGGTANALRAQSSQEMGRTQGYEQISQPTRFFRVGRVFKTPWSEPAGNVAGVEESLATESLGSTFFTKIRHFVVVREKRGCCLCLALFTHNGQGATKSGIDQDDYAAVYPAGGQPQIAPSERMTKASFGIIVEHPKENIHPMSRLNFARIYTVEHNVKVLKVGRIADADLPLLNEYFVSSNSLDLPTKLEGIHDDKQPSTSEPRDEYFPQSHYSFPVETLNMQTNRFNHPLEMGHWSQIPRTVMAQEPPTSSGNQRAAEPSIEGVTTRFQEELDSRYKVIPSKMSKSFWRIGRVFMLLWVEPAGSNGTSITTSRTSSHFSTTYLNGTAFSEIRRFIIIAEGYGNSICSPISTYSGQATLKKNLPEPKQHAIIYTSKAPPEELSRVLEDGSVERESLPMAPIRVIREQADDDGELSPLCRLNYSKVYTVEHNVRVLNIGIVHPNSLASLTANALVKRTDQPQGPRFQRDARISTRMKSKGGSSMGSSKER